MSQSLYGSKLISSKNFAHIVNGLGLKIKSKKVTVYYIKNGYSPIVGTLHFVLIEHLSHSKRTSVRKSASVSY